jgi:D-3-phosphoglycerate dehydrogenase
MAADELKDYLLNGNIVHSVNFPTVSLPRSGGTRLCVVHKNMPGALATITDTVSKAGLNIENLTNKSKGDYAYTLLDVTGSGTNDVAENIVQMPNMIRVRVL